ncbi:MAG: DsbA family protein [Gemmatimonadaceae bacterium]
MPVRDLVLNSLTVVVAGCALAVGGLRIHQFLAPPAATPGFPTEHVKNWRAFSDGGRRLGPSDAAVTIVEFADFQCPACRMAEPFLRELQRTNADVALVFRHLPLASHPYARPAARAAECAASLDRFEQYHDLLFQKAESIGTLTWIAFARRAGIADTTKFAQCLSTSNVDRSLARDSAAAESLHVEGTPTFLVNDLKVTGFTGRDAFSKLVADARKRAR